MQRHVRPWGVLVHSFSKKATAVLVAPFVGLVPLVLLTGGPADAAPPTRISGIVSVAGVGGVAGIKVTALKLGGTGQWAEADNAVTVAGGAYQIGKFTSGTYRVRFDDPSGAYETEFYNNVTRVDLAQDIVLTTGNGNFAGVDAELGAAAHFTGKVVNSSVVPIENATVTAYVRQVDAWVEFQHVTTAADGTYDLGGLPGGTYTLGFSDPVSGISEYWNDKATLDAADSLVVTNDGTQTGIDAALATPVEPTPTPTVTATATATSTATATATTTVSTAPVPVSAKTIAVLKVPKIKGIAKVGNRLRVTAGTVNPTAVARKIQWLANGKVIKKATKSRFVVTSKQVGKKLTVRVTISAPGYTTLAVKTRPSAKVLA
jgi:Carboxypeptidase regulatory-like domain